MHQKVCMLGGAAPRAGGSAGNHQADLLLSLYAHRDYPRPSARTVLQVAGPPPRQDFSFLIKITDATRDPQHQCTQPLFRGLQPLPPGLASPGALNP